MFSNTTLTSTADSVLEKESGNRKAQGRDNGSSYKSNETSISNEDATKSSKKKSRSARSKIFRMISSSTSLKSSEELVHDGPYLLRENKNNRKRITNKWGKSEPAVFKRKGTVASPSTTNHGQSSTDIETKEETCCSEEALTKIDRAAIRLDGIEVYAMVSALTIATSVSLFDLHRGQNLNWLNDLFQNGEYVSLITGICVLCASVSSILLGLHATLIFSLVTMYGRTAVGLGNDDGYSNFFQKTAHIRYSSFRSFHLSLYSFLVQVILTMLEKVPVEFRLVFGPFLVFFCYSKLYGDTENIIHLASNILFKPRGKKN